MKRALFIALLLISVAGFAVAPYLIIFRAPVLPNLGFIQKIFYFHVPCAWAMFLSVLICAVGSCAWLFANKRWGDRLAVSAAELTVVFGTLVLITGPLWAKVAWGRYWIWDVRLTTVFVLYLIFVAVLLARRYAGPAGRRIAAGLSLFGAAEVPLVYFSVNLWNAQHPPTSTVGTLHPQMKIAFFISLALFTCLYLLLLWIRLSAERLQQRTEELALRLMERDGSP